MVVERRKAIVGGGVLEVVTAEVSLSGELSIGERRVKLEDGTPSRDGENEGDVVMGPWDAEGQQDC